MWVAVSLAGCAAGQAGRERTAQPKPELEISSLSVHFAGADEGRFDLALTARQPNWTGAKATGLVWEAWINRRLFASGKVRLSALAVDASGSTSLPLSLPVIYRHLEYRSGPTRIQLRFRGTLELQRGPSIWSRDFERIEEIAVDGAPIPAAGLDTER